MNGTISIARAGQELGAWNAADVEKMLQVGVLTPGDHYWQEGMTEWTTLASFVPPQEATMISSVDSNPSHREAAAYRAEPLPRRSPWMKKPSHLAVALCLLFLIVGLCISLLTPADRGLTPAGRGQLGSSERHVAQVQVQPSRAAYEQRLAQTHAVLGPDGTIVIEDPDGATLSLTIDDQKDTDGRPSMPFRYEIRFHYDNIAILPNDDPRNSTLSEADEGMQFTPTVSLTFKDAPDATLSQAINNLVNWSVADAQSGAEPRDDIAGSDESDAYFVRCEPAQGFFYLILRKHNSFRSLQSMQSASALGYVIPVTSYERAHLWRYLIDHYGEVRQLAENSLSAQRVAAAKPDNP